MTTTTHIVVHYTKTGCREILRLHGAPDCDSAAMFIADKYGSTVKSATAIDADAPFQWCEMDAGSYSTGYEHANLSRPS